MKNALYILILITGLYSACDTSILSKRNGKEELDVSINTSNAIPSGLSKQEYIPWVKENTKVSKSINTYRFSANYLPPVWMILSEQPDITNQKQLDTLLNEYEHLSYFLFSIKNTEVIGELLKHLSNKNYNTYEELVRYFSFKIQNDFLLLDGKDTLTCAFSHFERSFDTNPQVNLLIAFEHDNAINRSSDLTLIYNDHLLDVGPIKLMFPKEFIQNIPTLKIDE